ncbi:hypothetical protein [Streptomyces sp. SID161]|uniref:hypothetical protein n=1 Tax=Streptomyces sp. SID161 TaxID=2690251 RepID=UPI00136D7195|nr:hypothetical protein [Streptomyces sp. SID161]MYW43850.1 hypothetical protein [Streptomyces sp. SID161]
MNGDEQLLNGRDHDDPGPTTTPATAGQRDAAARPQGCEPGSWRRSRKQRSCTPADGAPHVPVGSANLPRLRACEVCSKRARTLW